MSNKQPAIALILTLSILAMLSVSLMKSLDYRATEMRYIAASQADFELEVFARSTYRALAAGLTLGGPWGLFESSRGLVAYKDKDDPHFYPIAAPIAGGTIGNVRLRLLDQAFHLNPTRAFKDKSTQHLTLVNLLTQLQKTNTNFVSADIEGFLSEVNDFKDDNEESDPEFLIGGEQYTGLTPEFHVKNRQFDQLDEVKLLPSFAGLQLNQWQLKNNFRVFGPVDEAIDVNLASKQEIEDFLKRYEGIEDYPNLFSNAEDIAKIIVAGRSSQMPKYMVTDGNLFGRGSDLPAELEAAGITLTTYEQDLFKPTSELIEIEYIISMKGRTKKVSAIIEIVWDAKEYKPKSSSLLAFKLE